jgi:hypothetical protein
MHSEYANLGTEFGLKPALRIGIQAERHYHDITGMHIVRTKEGIVNQDRSIQKTARRNS